MTGPHFFAGRARLVVALVSLAGLACAVALAACAYESPSLEAQRERVVANALDEMTRKLSDALARGRRALAAVDAEIDSAEPDAAGRFTLLENIRAREGLQGLQYEDPGVAVSWAGVPAEPRDLPDPPAPWAGSFASGDVIFHSGPFRRAFVITATPQRGGRSAATVDLDEDSATTGPFSASVERRWAEKLEVRAIRVLPPSVLDRPAPAGVRRVAVKEPADRRDERPTLAVEVEPPADDDLQAAIDARSRLVGGWIGIGGLLIAALAAAAAIRRWVRPAWARALAVGLLPLLLRHGLALLDLYARFPALAPAYRTSDFGRTGWHGWLMSPADLLLTCVAILFASLGIARAVGCATGAPSDESAPRRGVARRGATVALGVLLTTAGAFLWLFFVETATFESKFDVFAPGALLPSVPRVLLLCALAAATASSWILARSGLRLVVACAAPRVTIACRIAPLAAAVVASLLATLPRETGLPRWAPFLVPIAAAAVGRLRAGALRPGAPSRVLLVSVLSTALLFPVLWRSSKSAAEADLDTRINELVTRKHSTWGQLVSKVPDLAGENEIIRALTAYGGRDSESFSDGLALQAWRKLGFDEGQGDEGAVYVYDRSGRQIDRFGINIPPYHRLPDPHPTPEDPDPFSILYVPWTHEYVGATIARLRLHAPDGPVVGTIAVLVPDALTVELAGLQPRIAALPPGVEENERRAGRIDLAVVLDGRVTQAGEVVPPSELPSIARLAALDGSEWVPPADGSGGAWLAVPADTRGIVLARAAPRGFEGVLYGVARAALVGVGAGAIASLLVLLLSLRKFRPRLQDKILWSYFAVSVVPLVFLGYANWHDSLARADDDFTSRQREVARSARYEIERTLPSGYDAMQRLPHYADIRGQDFTLFQHGRIVDSSLRSLADAEILPTRLDARVYRATEIEGRDFFVRPEWIAGRKVRVAYTPLRVGDKPSATLSVPLLVDADRAERRAAETGSVLLAAYLIALVLLVVIGIYTARGLAGRLTTLANATRRVAAGELGVALPRSGRDEVGALVDAFNVMTADLERLREREAAAQRETAWRGMARQVAHEIKNPLTPMKLMLQQLVATARSDPRFAAEMIEPTAKVVLEQIDTLARIASDFSAFARFPPRTLVDVDVNDLLRSVALLYTAGEPVAGVAQVETELAPDLLPVRWDRDELRRVFVNLVANSVEAVDAGAADPRRVRVVIRSRRGALPWASTAAPALSPPRADADRARSRSDGVVVSVADDGVGIAPEHMPRLFQPDFSTKTHGTGLGLAIVKRILTDLGGDIRVESELGKGTTVSLWLPTVNGTVS